MPSIGRAHFLELSSQAAAAAVSEAVRPSAISGPLLPLPYCGSESAQGALPAHTRHLPPRKARCGPGRPRAALLALHQCAVTVCECVCPVCHSVISPGKMDGVWVITAFRAWRVYGGWCYVPGAPIRCHSSLPP